MEKHSSNLNNGSSKVKLLCSYGGKIQSRPTDHQLSYAGGDTKILSVDRTVKFSDIIAKLNSLYNRNGGGEISVKYQLPGEDLDALVSLIDDEDVGHMMVEYDRMQRISAKPARLRIFVFDISARPSPPLKSGIKEPNQDPPPNPDYLFGFDKEYQPSIGPALDVLQISGIFPPVNGAAAAAGTAPAAPVVYRAPGVVSGGVYGSGAGYANRNYGIPLANSMVTGNREQPLYNFAPIMPSVVEPRMMVSGRNDREVKVNQRNF